MNLNCFGMDWDCFYKSVNKLLRLCRHLVVPQVTQKRILTVTFIKRSIKLCLHNFDDSY